MLKRFVVTHNKLINLVVNIYGYNKCGWGVSSCEATKKEQQRRNNRGGTTEKEQQRRNNKKGATKLFKTLTNLNKATFTC
jgi:hypothetical protein